MSFIDELTDWVKSKKRIFQTIDFINSFVKIDDTRGIEEKSLVFFIGNSEIRMSKDSIELSHGVYQGTKIFLEKDRIYFKYQNGTIVNVQDIKTSLDMTFREQPDLDIEDIIQIEPPIMYNPDNKIFTVRSGNQFQSGAIIPPDWITFNSKQAGSPELTGLSALTTLGLVRRTATGTYITDTSSGFGTIASQDANNVDISGGDINNASINNTVIGSVTPVSASFSKITINTPSTSVVPLTINTISSGADTLQVIRQDLSVGFRIYNSGSLEVNTGSFYRHSGNPVVGARRTGWTASSGTATRTGMVTSSATTIQVAERLKALLDDLIAHGLIGS